MRERERLMAVTTIAIASGGRRSPAFPESMPSSSTASDTSATGFDGKGRGRAGRVSPRARGRDEGEG